MSKQETKWPKKITVDKKIVQTLSGATYDSFPKSIKELIINSYDALATDVKITIDTYAQTLTVEDNGVGMTSIEFDFYIRIAGSARNKESSANSYYSRPKVGKFGIGFLSTFPFFQNFYIESKKKNAPEYLYANIPCYQYFDKEKQIAEVGDIPISGGVRLNNALANIQYTKIVLSGFTPLSWSFFNEEYNIKGRRDTILKYDAIKRLRWELSEDLPVKHNNNELNKILLFSLNELPFKTTLNDEELFRESYGNVILDQSVDFETIGDIKFKYFIATNYEPISPVESRYLKIRNLNVGVGIRETFGIGLEGRLYSKLAWITGEINVIQGLNDLIAASRDKFNYSPDFEAFKEFFRDKLRQWSINIESVNELKKDVSNIQQVNSIKDIRAISSSTITKQIQSLEKKGYKVKRESQPNNESSPININKEQKEITIYQPIEQIEKKLRIGDDLFILKEENWDYTNDFFPACKIINNVLTINSKYPLFNKNIFDSILKIQVILLKNYNSHMINSSAFTKIQIEILKTFI